MIHGMTAYSRRETKSNWGTVTWEIRSVNQRFLEIYFHLPEQLRNLEYIIRDRIRSCLTRGKIDCMLHLEQDGLSAPLFLNKELAKQLINAAGWIKLQTDGGEINPVDILRWPGVMVAQEKDLDMITSEVIIAFEDTLEDFIKVRKTEGQVIKVLIEQRLKRINIEVKKVRSRMPELLKWQRDRLINKLEDITSHLENNRLEQELILMAQRVDVHEELDRIAAYAKEIYSLLNKKEVSSGRRIDFIIQELNRESNTLASKAINIDITNSAIELKVLIEQMREQIQNIE